MASKVALAATVRLARAMTACAALSAAVQLCAQLIDHDITHVIMIMCF